MASSIVHKIAGTIKDARYYSLMTDAVTDSSNREQIAICLHWIDEKFDAHEDFIGLHIVELFLYVSSRIEGCFLRLNLSFTICRGQCCNGIVL